MAGSRFVFDRFELVPARGELREAGEPVRIGPKPRAVLTELLRHGGGVVSHDALRESVWPGLAVSDAAYASVVRDLRRALGDAGQEPRFIATVRGQGLRFVGDFLELPEDAFGGSGAEARGVGRPWLDVARKFEAALVALDRLQASRGTRTPLAGRERGELLLSLGRARWAAGATHEARSAFLDAARMARSVGDAETLARAALGFAGRTDVTLGVRKEAVLLLREALERLGGSAPGLRAELLARLGTELHHDSSGCDDAEGLALTARAVEIAEAAGDPPTLAYALTAFHFVRQRPDFHPRDRLRVANRAVEIAEALPPSDILALAHQERLLDLLELGDGRGFAAAWPRYDAVVEELGQPFFGWIRELFRGNRALLTGDPAEAERRAESALELGRGIGTPNALSAFAGQLFAIRLVQDRLGELLPLLLAEARRSGALPVFRAAALAAAAERDGGAANREVELCALLEASPRPPRDHHELAALALLVPAAEAARKADPAERLRARLDPFRDRVLVVGYGAATLGSVAHVLARLAARLGDRNAARTLLDAAELHYAGLGAVLWQARLQRDRARLGLD